MAKKKKESDFESLDRFNGYNWFYRNKKYIRDSPNKSARELAMCDCKNEYKINPDNPAFKTWEERKEECIAGAIEAGMESERARITKKEKKIKEKELEIKANEKKIIKKELENLEWQIGTMSEGNEYKEAIKYQAELRDKLDELEKKHKTKNR